MTLKKRGSYSNPLSKRRTHWKNLNTATRKAILWAGGLRDSRALETAARLSGEQIGPVLRKMAVKGWKALKGKMHTNPIPTIPDREMGPLWDSMNKKKRRSWLKKAKRLTAWANYKYYELPNGVILDIARTMGIR